MFGSFEAVSLAGEGVSVHSRLIVGLSVLLLDDSMIPVLHLDTLFSVHLFHILAVRALGRLDRGGGRGCVRGSF